MRREQLLFVPLGRLVMISTTEVGDVVDLSEHCIFEEVCYLLLHGDLPNKDQLKSFTNNIISKRSLPDSLKIVLETIPKETNPMDVLRTACSFLGNIEPEKSFDNQMHCSERLLGIFPSALNYWYHFSHSGNKISEENDSETIAGHFYILTRKKANRDRGEGYEYISYLYTLNMSSMHLHLPREYVPLLYRTFILVLPQR